MKKRGFTLIELMVALVLSAILFFALIAQFIIMVRFVEELKNRIESVREARIAIRHMVRIMKFGIPETVAISPGGHVLGWTLPGTPSPRMGLDVIVGEGSIGGIPANVTQIAYLVSTPAVGGVTSLWIFGWNADSQCIYQSKVCGNMDFATADLSSWDPDTGEILLQLIFTKNNVGIPIETKIKLLGTPYEESPYP